MKPAPALLLFTLLLPIAAHAGDGPYVPETDPLVLKKLAAWQDWKFGLMLHWGPYSQWGVVESWSICSEDLPWCARPSGISYVDYKKRYEQLPTTFNPTRFDPDTWARAARDAGMRYVVFTTKHHDGFSMFDTRQTDYRITAPDVPFHRNPRANIAREVFGAFRAQGFGIGAYFSKADWHNTDYWAPEWATPTRNNNYDTRKYPERWKRFVDFTHRQVGELTSQYGPIDILWLDAGWVNPYSHPHALAYSDEVPWPQDIDMPGLAALARRNQPGLIVVDRDVGGKYEDYRTPEQQVPAQPLPYPWETCMTMGDSWSYKPDDRYKPARELVHILVDVVAKGGNFLLNVGPDATGQLPAPALERMRDIGAWMKVNASAIYASHPVAPYAEGKLRFTQLKDGSVNAIYLADEGETLPPATITLTGLRPAAGAMVQLLGTTTPLTATRARGATTITLPAAARRQLAGAYAWTIHLSAIQH
ncbi:MAG TPA: alpha-L-fucosidase [Frateuria sp.]|uniref:alpha-L-fucosidase n=1 Tax=Frateuria sp. TaxID=2211372 RepID=UPI002DF60782|nr:alpha-L-fucosidase [Frateuria sp.]